eukprot:gene26213-biopygen14936
MNIYSIRIRTKESASRSAVQDIL